MSLHEDNQDDLFLPLQSVRLIHDNGKKRARFPSKIASRFFNLFLTAYFWIDLSVSTSLSFQKFNLTKCPDVSFSLTAESKVCVGESLHIAWTAPQDRSYATAICFFRANNSLPHGCQSIPVPPSNPCQQISSFMGILTLSQSISFWTSLVSQVGVVHAVFASDCDETKASDWFSPSPSNSRQPSRCIIHGRADFVVILRSSAAGSSQGCDGVNRPSAVDVRFALSVATGQVYTCVDKILIYVYELVVPEDWVSDALTTLAGL
jgi:hypothetical protein